LQQELFLLLPLELLVHGLLALQEVRIDVDRGLWLRWRLEGLERHLKGQLMRSLTLQMEIGIDVHLPRHGRLSLVGAQMGQHVVTSLGYLANEYFCLFLVISQN